MQSRLALALLIAGACSAPAPSRSREPDWTNDETLRLDRATQAVQRANERTTTALAVEIATHGLEPQRCGFHLIRPDDDPSWTGEYGPSDPTLRSGGFFWDSRPVRYMDVQYQHRNLFYQDQHGNIFPAEELPPGFVDNHGWCLLSNERVFGNEIVRASALAEPGGTFAVSAAIDERALDALSARLADQVKNRDGTVLDWFGRGRDPAARRTRMRVALVSNSIAYLPVDVSALVEASAPTTVTLARGLSRSEAEQLARWLETP